MYKEREKYDLQKMKTRSTEILHVEGEIRKEQTIKDCANIILK